MDVTSVKSMISSVFVLPERWEKLAKLRHYNGDKHECTASDLMASKGVAEKYDPKHSGAHRFLR